MSARSNILFAFAVAVLLFGAWQVREVLLLIYVAALFAVVVTPGVEFIQRLHLGRWHPNRGFAIILLVVGLIALITLFLVFALPPIFSDLHTFSQDLPAKASIANARLHRLPFADRLDLPALQEHLAAAAGGLLGLARRVAGGLFGFFSAIILIAYFIIDGRRAFHWFLSMVPARYRPRLEETAVVAELRVSKWLVGQLMLMLILGVLSTVIWGLLRVKYFYALGVFAGLANIVPIVGPLLSVTLAVIVAAFDSWTKALLVVGFYIVYQQLENAYLTPKIMKSTVDLPALTVIIALTIGGALAGILGALIAVPTAALIAVILDEFVIKQNSDSPTTKTSP